MKDTYNYNWLQLSDLHIFSSSKWELMKDSYKRILRNKKIDFIIVTGDLHQIGNNYDKTIEFLNDFVEFLGIRKNDVYILPGNHDIEGFQFRELIVKDIVDHIENEDDYLDKYYEQLLNSYNKYIKFLEDFYQEKDINNFKEILKGHHVFTRENQINIVCVNSTYICNGNRNHKEIINTKSLSNLNIKNNLPSILCMHHNINDLYNSHFSILKRVVINNNINACLCGDLHINKLNELDKITSSVPCITCGKASFEPKDNYSEFGFILYSYSSENNRVVYQPYIWESNQRLRFEKGHMFDDDNGKPPYFNVPSISENQLQHFIKNESENTEDEPIINDIPLEKSIWLPDAELATGKQTRFKTFTKTRDVVEFLEKGSMYWGVTSVKGIGKTFLLQVKRMKLSSNSICFPIVPKPNKDNNWATECIKFENDAIFIHNESHNDIKMLWKHSIICYIIHSWFKLQSGLESKKQNGEYLSFLKWLKGKLKNNEISKITYELIIEDEYSKLKLIFQKLLNQSDWKRIITNDYLTVQALGIKITNSIANDKKNTMTLFFDKLDQSLRQPNSEEALDCVICSKRNNVNDCKDPNKSSEYCLNCIKKFDCCYGCEKFSSNYSDSLLRIYNNAKQDIVHVNYWQRIQLALIEAVCDIKDDFDGKIKVIYTIRYEAYNSEDNVLGENRHKIMSLTKVLKYSKDEHKKIYNECIANQNEDYLVKPELAHKKGMEDQAFVGIDGICHPYVTNITEPIFDIIYRHSFDRTRDIQEYGQAITNNIEEIRYLDEDKRKQVVKEIIEKTAAKLAYNSNKSTRSSENSYYFEKMPIMPSYWADSHNFEDFIKQIDRNLLLSRDIIGICKNVNQNQSCTGLNCDSCTHYPFSMLYRLGLLGYISIDQTGFKESIQKFLSSDEITYFHEENVLPINNHTLYIIHPALTKSIEALKGDKIMHFCGFILGKDLLVNRNIINEVLREMRETSCEEFEKKYYKKIED